MSADFVTTFLNHVVVFIAANPSLAGFICFFVAMGEALFLIGLVFPSTVVLVGAGTLIGLGELNFLSIFIWTTAGAVTGDAFSYWFGYFYKDRVRSIWPLSKYPDWLQRGEDYFAEHGGKSIFIGRFVPGVKSVVPGIAGMADMSFRRFTFFNVTSALAWSAIHLLPGVLAGSALFAIGEFNTRLAVIFGGLLLFLLVSIAMIRWLIMFILPVVGDSHQAIVSWFSRRPNRFSQWIAHTYDPENPRSVGMLVSAFFLLVTLPGFIWFTGAVAPGMPMARADLAISNFFQIARTPVIDEIMVMITMMGDGMVTATVTFAAGIYLFARKAWRRATGFVIAIASSSIFVVITKALIGRYRPIELYSGADSFSFPSGHATINTVLVGVLAVLAAHDRSRLTKTVVYSIAATYAILIGFSRIYLGAHWLSDVLAGLLFGAGTVFFFSFVFGHIHNEKIGRNALIVISVIALALASVWHINANYATAAKAYEPRSESVVIQKSSWRVQDWRLLPANRVSLSGDLEEPIILQWSGTPEDLELRMKKLGWQNAPEWSVPTATGYLKGETPAGALPPVPHTNTGFLPALTMVYENDQDHRQVFWLWETRFKLSGVNGTLSTLYIGGSLDEETVRLFGEFSGLKSEDEIPADLKMFNMLPNASEKLRWDGSSVVIAGP
ncbi:bifunctional DedA family/phosphatase PAP2 family protein [Pseudovibrio sp. Tun.PSC04-5.I4]|uniref:bifunctional DedA family/phosphatase PAP2 family protein n=1 Tax=Pseudovibrio sp. Tun.PSC04-5.I4 TaxID=1798213 RepID=UPI0008832A6E|nr:bifunctional DedA family/phosphatase PAP2 family protein [Pseudovibrio sp. Tun.PSC04-5.I4]SDR25737.1 undecaprenyl-diphosphatase [Pseudovibrio sp. Tun.PSC04-5.I4]